MSDAPAADAPAASPTAESLRSGRCQPCEGGVPTLSDVQVAARVNVLEGWATIDDGAAIRKKWNVGSFTKGLSFFQRVGEVAEEEGHHPDLHLTGYRNAAIVLTTHAVAGLTENDFILAAKIDALGDPKSA